MSPDLNQALGRLPRLDRRRSLADPRKCKVCAGGSIFFDAVDFNKWCSADNFYEFGTSGVTVNYYQCVQCGSVFTDFFDDWSAADFSRYIYNEDYIKVDREYVQVRPAFVANDMAQRFSGGEDLRILDYGAGAGIFVKQMRKSGFYKIEGYDPFSSPKRPEGLFDVITCFEVLEHSVDPRGMLGDIKSLLRPGGIVVFSQTLQPDDLMICRGNWWYLAPRNGHVTTYNEQALTVLGEHCSMSLYGQENVYAFAPNGETIVAHKVLASVGPRLGTAWLYAPEYRPHQELFYPEPSSVWWYPSEDDGVWQYRWSGSSRLLWRLRWRETSIIDIRIPLAREVQPGFAAQCYFLIGEEQHPARLSRGAIATEFKASGTGEVLLELRTPEPLPEYPENQLSRPVGLAVLASHEPLWPSRQREVQSEVHAL